MSEFIRRFLNTEELGASTPPLESVIESDKTLPKGMVMLLFRDWHICREIYLLLP
jgi:hypothetical protein